MLPIIKNPLFFFLPMKARIQKVLEFQNELAESLNVSVVNIDELKSINIKKIFKFKKKSYQEYLNNFCTTKKNFLPNHKLIIPILNSHETINNSYLNYE